MGLHYSWTPNIHNQTNRSLVKVCGLYPLGREFKSRSVICYAKFLWERFGKFFSRPPGARIRLDMIFSLLALRPAWTFPSSAMNLPSINEFLLLVDKVFPLASLLASFGALNHNKKGWMNLENIYFTLSLLLKFVVSAHQNSKNFLNFRFLKYLTAKDFLIFKFPKKIIPLAIFPEFGHSKSALEIR